jgi:hypothetical protein
LFQPRSDPLTFRSNTDNISSVAVTTTGEMSVRAGVLAAMLLAVMGLTTGCSSKCEAVCASANVCDVSERPADVECTPYCADVDSLQQRAVAAGQPNCDTQFQAHLDCWANNSAQVCSKEFTGCAEAAKAWTDCLTPYCAAILAEKKTDPSCTSGRPTLRPF